MSGDIDEAIAIDKTIAEKMKEFGPKVLVKGEIAGMTWAVLTRKWVGMGLLHFFPNEEPFGLGDAYQITQDGNIVFWQSDIVRRKAA